MGVSMPGSYRRVALALAFATMLPYLGTLAFGFTYDDHWTIETNAWLLRPPFEVIGAVVHGDGTRVGIPDASRPLMVLSNMFDRRVFGLHPAFHHAHSVLLHGIASVLAAALAFAILRSRRAAILAGLFFGVAPIHVEVVASVHYREDLLATIGLFGFLACMLAPSARVHDPRRAWLACGSLAFGLLGKESAIVALAALPLLALERPLNFWKRRERTLVGTLVVSLLYVSWRAGLTAKGDGVARGAPLIWPDALVRTARALLDGAVDVAIPRLPIPIHPPLPEAGGLYWVAFAACASVALALALRARTRPFAYALALTLLLPVASTPVTGAANEQADRYLYAAVLGPALAFGWIVARARVRWPSAERVAMVIVVMLGVFTARASAVFRSDDALFAAAVDRAPRSARAHTALAYSYRMRGDVDASDRELAVALALDPRYVRARVGQAMTALVRGDGDAANAILDAIEASGQHVEGLEGARRCARLPRGPAARCANGDSD